MPYSLSHAIVALPIRVVARNKIPLAAVIVGSVSPDIPYFIALTPVHAPGHSIMGALVYCLLPSFLILAVWYRWLEIHTLQLFGLPQARHNFSKSYLVRIAIGVLIGVYSHVLWDATSHYNGIFVAQSEFWNTRYYALPLFKWNQYVSGVLGLLALLIWYIKLWRDASPRRYKGDLVTGIIIYTASIVFFILLANFLYRSSDFHDFAVQSSVGFMTGGVVAVCIYSLVMKLRSR